MSVNDDKDLSFCLSTCGPISNKCQGRTLMIYTILLLVDDATKDLFRTVVEVYQLILVTFQFVLTIAATGPFELVDG